MNGFVVDNVACGGCHTLLTATKGSNVDFTNNDFSVVDEQARPITLPELPPLQKVPTSAMSKTTELPLTADDITNSNVTETIKEGMNGNPPADENGSIDSLEANVSGSHIVNINDLENDNASIQGVPDLGNEAASPIEKTEVMAIIDSMDTAAENVTQNMKDGINSMKSGIDSMKDEAKENIEAVEEIIKKTAVAIDPGHKCEEMRALNVPDKVAEIANSPPPKSPLLQELLEVPDLTQLTLDSDDGTKSENETIPCASDKSSPQAGKTKTQAVLPIVRSDDTIDTSIDQEHNESEVVAPEKGRFSRLFQSIRDKENSCMGKGKVIEENVQGM